jgi:hypothetical protein
MGGSARCTISPAAIATPQARKFALNMNGSPDTHSKGSLPERLAAPVPKSERTKAHEAPGIRLTYDNATMPSKKGKHMKPWRQINHYAGFEFAHTQAGGQSFREKTAAYPNLAVAIETNQTAVVHCLTFHFG